MVYKSFRLQCIFRILLICVIICLFFFLLFRTNLFVTTTMIGLLFIYQVYVLIRYVDKTNKLLTRFLQSIKYSDFTQSFGSGVKGSAFGELNDAFTEVIQEFQRIRTEKEEHFHYLQTVVQHIGIGLIAFNQNGDVELINKAAKQLLKVHHLRKIKDLQATSKELADLLSGVEPGGKHLIKLYESEDLIHLSIYATRFMLRQQRFTLVSLQNIRSELEEQEMEAWQNLIRVLTHEIMNSIAPISSLASTTVSLISGRESTQSSDPDADVMNDVREAIQTIEKRSTGLLDFVENYRKLTRIPRPNFENITVKDLFERIRNLMADPLEQKNIKMDIDIKPATEKLTADGNLIEQVLINLCKNSCTENNPLLSNGSINPALRPIAHTFL